jgi:hypothetical protein
MLRAGKWARHSDRALELQALKMFKEYLEAQERVLEDEEELALKKS